MAAFWVTKTDAPATNSDAACCGYGDYLYILTGNNEFWRYEPATDTWTTTLTPPSFSRNNDAAMAGYNGYLYVWGGATVGGPNSTDLLRYNIATDTWDTSLTAMPNKQANGGGALLNGKLYYVCGFDETSTESTTLLVTHGRPRRLALRYDITVVSLLMRSTASCTWLAARSAASVRYRARCGRSRETLGPTVRTSVTPRTSPTRLKQSARPSTSSVASTLPLLSTPLRHLCWVVPTPHRCRAPKNIVQPVL
jgi:hypothetical protein